MKEAFKEFLFTKHILVSDFSHEIACTDAFATIVALAKRFSIRITENVELAQKQLIEDAAHCLGEYVPEPFYRGFPASVRELTSEQLLYDQLYHYTTTYGLGWWEEAGHSVIEQVYERIGFNEYAEPKDFVILPEKEAEKQLKDYVRGLLSGNRPLNVDQLIVVTEAYREYKNEVIPEEIPCKDTVIRLLYTFQDMKLCWYMKLSDVIKLLGYIQFTMYGSENLKKLNLRNKDRKFLTKVLDYFLGTVPLRRADHQIDISTCHEKRKIWCGLLHHIHYQPKTPFGREFVEGIRSGKNMSCLSVFEDFMKKGKPVTAAKYISRAKGTSFLVRNLNYILSRCDSEHEIEEVLKCLE